MTNDTLKRLAERRSAIETAISAHKASIAKLEAEFSEIDIAERVLHRLDGPEQDSSADEQELASQSRKPPNTPTVPEMILEVLQARRAVGLGGLEPKGMAHLIAKRWWPDVTATEVSPIAWRMMKRGQLLKEGSLYSLPRPTFLGSAALPPGKQEFNS